MAAWEAGCSAEAGMRLGPGGTNGMEQERDRNVKKRMLNCDVSA